MSTDIKKFLSNSANAEKFARSFIEGYLSPAFGAQSKTEIDLLVFSCLVAVNAIDPNGAIFDIARALNITPAKARGLLLNWQLRSILTPADLRQALVTVLQKTRFSKDGTLLTFGIESPLLKEEVVASLKRKGYFPDASFAKEIIKLPVEAFVEFLDDIVDKGVKDKVRIALIKDKQLPDKSFKALATGILKKIGEKVADEAGKELAGDIVEHFAAPATKKAISFLSGLLAGDVNAATKGISKTDFIDV